MQYNTCVYNAHIVHWASATLLFCAQPMKRPCFDSFGWMVGRASILLQLSSKVLFWRTLPNLGVTLEKKLSETITESSSSCCCRSSRTSGSSSSISGSDCLWVGKPPQYFTKPPRPTKPPALSGMGNEYWPKCSDALWLESKGHLWINMWEAGRTVWSLVNTCHTWVPRDE